jgi:cyclopropane-fatty-acyl-phospholipid synthase
MSSTITLDSASTATRNFLDHLFAKRPLRNVAFRLWDQSAWPEPSRAATIVLNHPGALRRMLAPGTAKGLAEAYLRNDFDVEGDMEQAIELATALEERPAGSLAALADYCRLMRLPAGDDPASEGRACELRGSRHSQARDRQAVSFHYDVSNDFYRLWLDARMVYSCAYFRGSPDDLDAAQLAKLDHICRKLRLRPGQRLLDIGCGWGALAIHAAQRYGVEALGVTLSTQQAGLAAERARQAGVEGRVKIELCDYRDVRAPAGGFDAISSVGMAEHVGREHLPDYFRTAARLLKPGGGFLNHAIGEGRREDRFQGPSFVDAYVFPDSDIPPLPVTVSAAAAAQLEVRDVENLREHYAITLRHWVSRLEAAHDQALKYVDEPTYRIWRLYMAASAHGFAHGDLAIYQTLLVKPDADGRADLPLTRDDWYR